MLLLGNVVDQFLNQHRLAHAGAAEQTDFTTFTIRFEQVNHLDARVEHLLHRRQVLELRRLAVDRVSALAVQFLHAVDGVAHHVHQAAFDLVAHRHGNRATQRAHFHAPLQAIRTIHGHGTHRVLADVLLHLHNQSLPVGSLDFQRIMNARQHQFGLCFRSFKVNVHNRSDYLRNMSNHL